MGRPKKNTTEETVVNNTTYVTLPKSFKRDANGLLEGINYVFEEDTGLINYRKMVSMKYLTPNQSLTSEKDISKLDDSKLLITLGGIRSLAILRGFINVVFRPIVANPNYVSTVCAIDWIGNYETNGRVVHFEAMADASSDSTRGFAMNYLTAIAENRAFTRCVRNFLNINIVGEEEIGNATPDANSQPNIKDNTPHSTLSALMRSKGISFDGLKNQLIQDNYAKIDEVTDVTKIDLAKVFELIQRLEKLP